MNYILETAEKLDKKFFKMAKKRKNELEIINNKVEEILFDPTRFKHLKGPMKGELRVHIHKSFVLTFEIDEDKKIVRLIDYDHHDNIYKK
jgi:YafQ family addiction module toxin component